jgi:hypothetical protein
LNSDLISNQKKSKGRFSEILRRDDAEEREGKDVSRNDEMAIIEKAPDSGALM